MNEKSVFTSLASRAVEAELMPMTPPPATSGISIVETGVFGIRLEIPEDLLQHYPGARVRSAPFLHMRMCALKDDH